MPHSVHIASTSSFYVLVDNLFKHLLQSFFTMLHHRARHILSTPQLCAQLSLLKNYRAYSSGNESEAADLDAAREWFYRFTKSTIPSKIGQTTFSRSSGPGGQKTNKYVPKRNIYSLTLAYRYTEQAQRPRLCGLSMLSRFTYQRCYIKDYETVDTMSTPQTPSAFSAIQTGARRTIQRRLITGSLKKSPGFIRRGFRGLPLQSRNGGLSSCKYFFWGGFSSFIL